MPIFMPTTQRQPRLAWALLPAMILSACATATPPPAPPSAPQSPTTELTIPDNAKPIIDRLVKQYAPLQGLTVIARHLIQKQSRVLHESMRQLTFAKPNKFRIDVDGKVIVTSDGNACWQFNREMLGYNQVPAPQSMTQAMTDIPTLGGGSISGAGGLVAALLSVNARTALLDNIDAISVFPADDDDILVLQIKANRGTVRKGTRIVLHIPKAGPAWIVQADLLPQKDMPVHTRIVFEQWTPSKPPSNAFELDPQALKLNTLDSPEKTTP